MWIDGEPGFVLQAGYDQVCVRAPAYQEQVKCAGDRVRFCMKAIIG